MTMKLYSGDLSPYSARVRMQIYAKGITDIAIERPPTFGTPQFRQDHPIGRIPVLEIDGEAMPESDVIAEYIEEIYPEPSLLGATPRETAQVRTLARVGDIYLMNNMFMLSGQTRAATRNEGVIDLLAGQVVRNTKALDRMIGRDGFACLGRVTLADCALVPALFLIENVLPGTGVADPIAANSNVAAYWAAIQTQEHAARILVELHRGLVERRELDPLQGDPRKMMAANRAAMEVSGARLRVRDARVEWAVPPRRETDGKAIAMTYAPAGRAIYDADSHIMELPDFLKKYADPQLRDDIPEGRAIRPRWSPTRRWRLSWGGAGVQPRARRRPNRARRQADRVVEKEIQGLGAFDAADRVTALDMLGFARQLVFAHPQRSPCRSRRRARSTRCCATAPRAPTTGTWPTSAARMTG